MVETYARKHELKILVQPSRNRVSPFVQTLRREEIDIVVICSYSMILPLSVIETARIACINLHGGILPDYRGPHVLNWAVIRGEKETGVTLHHLDEGVDTGDIIDIARIPIEEEDTAITLESKITERSVELLARWWHDLVQGSAPRWKQPHEKGGYFPARTPEDGRIDWSLSSREVFNLVRALVRPWPGAFVQLGDRRMVAHRVLPVQSGSVASDGLPAGTISEGTDGLAWVKTGDGMLSLREIEVDGTNLKGSDILSWLRASGIRRFIPG
jgi:methionyl-tRNA formyltransferase